MSKDVLIFHAAVTCQENVIDKCSYWHFTFMSLSSYYVVSVNCQKEHVTRVVQWEYTLMLYENIKLLKLLYMM